MPFTLNCTHPRVEALLKGAFVCWRRTIASTTMRTSPHKSANIINVSSLFDMDSLQIRCIIMENTPRTCTTRDIYRFLREETMVDIKNTARSVEADPSGSILRVLRLYASDYTPTNTWLAAFNNSDAAAQIARNVIGGCIGTSRIESKLTLGDVINEFRPVNILMEEPECCLNLRGYPPGAGPAMIADLFREFKIKKTKAAGGPAIHQRTQANYDTSDSGTTCIVEFDSIDQAQRALYNLANLEQCSTIRYAMHAPGSRRVPIYRSPPVDVGYYRFTPYIQPMA